MGPINLDGLFAGLIIIGVALGAIFSLLFMWLLPKLWDLIKPWLHAVTG